MSNNKSTYNYGKCHVCGEQMKEKRINQDSWLKGKLVVIESVPAGVCPQCGEISQGRRRTTACYSDPKPQALAQAKNDDCACGSIREGSGLSLNSRDHVMENNDAEVFGGA